MTSGPGEWVCRGCTGDFEGAPSLILHHEKTGAIQRFCEPCASVTHVTEGQKVEQVSLEDVGVPVPKLTDWPVPGTIFCEHHDCALMCVAVENEKGSNRAKYICGVEGHGPTIYLASRKDDWAASKIGWVFKLSPF